MALPEEYITLWHTGGDAPCNGRAFEVRPHFLRGACPLEVEDVSHIAQSGSRVRCLSCGEGLMQPMCREVSPLKPREAHRAR